MRTAIENDPETDIGRHSHASEGLMVLEGFQMGAGKKGGDTGLSRTVGDWTANWGHAMACKEVCKKIDVFDVP